MSLSLKKSFLTGVFVILPIVLSATLLLWFFQKVDALFSPVIDGIVSVVWPGMRHIPGTGLLAGLLIIYIVGAFARNVFGAKVLAGVDWLIDRIPGYRTVYTTIKQLTNAFSPESTRSFKEVLLVEYPRPGAFALGFLTMTVERQGERLAVVFVPTNNLYLGEVIYIPETTAVRLEMTVEQAVRILVSGGIASPRELRVRAEKSPQALLAGGDLPTKSP